MTVINGVEFVSRYDFTKKGLLANIRNDKKLKERLLVFSVHYTCCFGCTSDEASQVLEDMSMKIWTWVPHIRSPKNNPVYNPSDATARMCGGSRRSVITMVISFLILVHRRRPL